MILTTKNNLYVSGLNIFGQLGLGDYENRYNFSKVNIYNDIFKNNKEEKIIDIQAGAQHSLLLSNKNKVYYCGFNKNNFLDKNEDINLFTPILDEKIKDKKIKLIRAGMNISCILFDDKITFSIFGQDLEFLNKSSEMILLNINNILNKEKSENNSLYISDIKLGQEFILILLSNGDIYTSGINAKNRLGVENKEIISNKERIVFYKVSLPEKAIQIECGYDNSIVVSESGKIYGWGSNYYGQICSTKKSSLAKPILISNSSIKDLTLDKISTGAYLKEIQIISQKRSLSLTYLNLNYLLY